MEPVGGERDESGDARGDPPAEESDEPSGPSERAVWLPSERVLPVALVALLLAITLAVLSQLRLVASRRRLRGDRWRAPARAPAPEPPIEEDDTVAGAIDAGLEELGVGPPRDAIVAAWLRLEQAAESGRFRRDPADTPSEFVERVLSSYSLDARAIGRLAALYGEARFSEHPISEPQRDEARACLTTLLADLRAPTVGRGGDG